MIYYFGALGFSENCLGAVPENQQKANLGDGQGAHNQSTIQRWNYGDFNFGSCQETVHGGNHFRLWVRGRQCTSILPQVLLSKPLIRTLSWLNSNKPAQTPTPARSS